MTATRTLSALPVPPAVTATPRASEKGEKPPHRVGDTCLPGPGEEAPPNPQAEERGSDPSAPCLFHLQFPLYWFSVPAVLKGWMDRVLCQGFAFDIPGFYDDGLLKVRPDEGRRPSGMEGASQQVTPSLHFLTKH